MQCIKNLHVNLITISNINDLTRLFQAAKKPPIGELTRNQGLLATYCQSN